MCPPENIHVCGHGAVFRTDAGVRPYSCGIHLLRHTFDIGIYTSTCAVTVRHSGGHIGPPLLLRIIILRIQST